MNFNFQKSVYNRKVSIRDFSLYTFYQKCLPPYKGVEKEKSLQFNQSTLIDKNNGVNYGNILYSESITLDFDNGITEVEYKNIIDKIESKGFEFCIYKTASSKKDNIRFRIIFPIGERVNKIEYRKLAEIMSFITVNKKVDKQSFSIAQRYRLANKGSYYYKGKAINEIVKMDLIRKKAKEESTIEKTTFNNKKPLDIVSYILNKYELTIEGTRNSELNRALYHASKLNAEPYELEEIARHSTLPTKEIDYMLRRYSR